MWIAERIRYRQTDRPTNQLRTQSPKNKSDENLVVVGTNQTPVQSAQKSPLGIGAERLIKMGEICRMWLGKRGSETVKLRQEQKDG